MTALLQGGVGLGVLLVGIGLLLFGIGSVATAVATLVRAYSDAQEAKWFACRQHLLHARLDRPEAEPSASGQWLEWLMPLLPLVAAIVGTWLAQRRARSNDAAEESYEDDDVEVDLGPVLDFLHGAGFDDWLARVMSELKHEVEPAANDLDTESAV